MTLTVNELFERRIAYPDFDMQDRLGRLVGLDTHKTNLLKGLGLRINPQGYEAWAQKHYKDSRHVQHIIARKPALFILSGDVGSGKTELAETIGDAVARQEGIDITLFPLSLSARGQGKVGEMTQLVSAAFDTVVSEASKLKGSGTKARGGVILLLDEADALAQSRETSQMHHEDKAGVNAFIRGLDRINNNKLPAAVIMCTNRLTALDPAVKRRASDILLFERPSDAMRQKILSESLIPLGFTNKHIEVLVEITGKQKDRDYGFAFSDITQRLLPMIVLDAYPHGPINPDKAIEVARSVIPTSPFHEATI